MTEVVLDASAILAVFRGEAGADRVSGLLSRALVSAVNYAEVIAKLVDFGVPAGEAVGAVSQLAADVVAVDQAMAAQIGALREQTRAAGLSMGDRACIALAKIRGLPALTADRAWAAVDAGVEIVLIR